MHLIGLPKLDEFKKKYLAEHGVLDAWRSLIELAQGESFTDIERYFPTANLTDDERVVFFVKGKTCQIALKVRIQNRIVLLEWIGTRAQWNSEKTTNVN